MMPFVISEFKAKNTLMQMGTWEYILKDKNYDLVFYMPIY
jgi:hypothetical protein